MKNVYYIGYYSGEKCQNRRNCSENAAATVKMNFIIDSLKTLGYHVHLISISLGSEAGIYRAEHITIDELEDHYYVPYFSIKLKNKNCFGGQTAWLFLKMYALFHFKRKDIVITYHSLMYHRFWVRLHKIIGFRWVPQVEEIYCLSRKDYQNEKYLKREEKMFLSGDGFLFVNDIMAQKYANGRVFAVSYGNYNVYAEKDTFIGEKIGIVYTGIINHDRGVFKLIDAMQYLPSNYELHILGFGSDENMKIMKEHIANANKMEERVFFEGVRTGKAYTEFLLKYQIGVSLMDTSEDVAENAFPSKIMAYLGHSLFVVSSKCSSIVNSQVADSIYFCDDSAEDIAKTICEIPVHMKNNSANKLKELKALFLKNLQIVLENGRIGD